VMCWLRRMPVMSRAAAFCAASRRRMTTSATPYSAACIQWSKWLVTKAWAIRFKLFNCSNCSTVPVQCVVFGHKYTNVTDIARQNWMNQSWRKVAQVDHEAKVWKRSNVTSKSERSRSYEAEDKFEGLTKVSFSTTLARVAYKLWTVTACSTVIKCYRYYITFVFRYSCITSLKQMLELLILYQPLRIT